MNVLSHSAVQSRRTFCAKFLMVSAVGCIGCAKLVERLPSSGTQEALAATDRFSEDSKMSFREVYEFGYRNRFIPMMLGISAELGREKTVEMLKRINSERAAREAQDWAKEIGKNDLESYIADQRNPDYFTSHVRTSTIVEDTKKAFEEKVTDCLWAKTFLAADVSDIGYACFCSGEYAAVPAYNSKMQLIRTKTLMQGDEFCNPRYVLRDL